MSATHVWVEHRPPAFQGTSGMNILRERPLKSLLQGAGPGQGQSDTGGLVHLAIPVTLLAR